MQMRAAPIAAVAPGAPHDGLAGDVRSAVNDWLDASSGPLLPAGAHLYPLDAGADPAALEAKLRDYLRSLSGRHDYEPSTNPVLALALFVGHLLDSGEASPSAIEQLVQRLTLKAFAARADHAAAYIRRHPHDEPRINPADHQEILGFIPADVPFETFRLSTERPLFGIVFTAHPTFSITPDLSRLLAELFCGRDLAGQPLSPAQIADIIAEAASSEHRPPADLTLAVEHRWSLEALANAQAALDRLNRMVLETARDRYPDRWTELRPSLLTLATWVGYDLDGRADITWRETLEKRLLVKLAQFRRFETSVAAMKMAEAGEAAVPLERLRLRLAKAVAAVEEQLALLARFGTASPAADVAPFARAMVDGTDAALVSTEPLEPLLAEALAAAPGDPLKLSILVLRAGLRSHGLGLAHTHVRLNASQIHNSIRSLVGLESSPADPTRRRTYIAAANDLLAGVRPEAISYGSIREERASARRLFMIVAQMLKHIDADTPVRFLVAETESGFTLLAALYFAKLFGIEEKIEISPLFETNYALNHGDLIIDEALKSPHFRAYVERTGKLCVQFGYSDSGRYLGQMAATFLIERLRLRIGAVMERHGLTGVELVLFDTHGESIGRGAHPRSLADRFAYLAPAAANAAFARAGIAVKQESSFQGGDGYGWFMHPDAATAVLTTALASCTGRADEADDPVYARSDYAAEFFNTVEDFFARVVEDPDYAALLGVFGMNLLERTGSRPVKRQTDLGAGPLEITHPSQLRAIPNNAVLQQLGLLANVVGGLGRASAIDPETFAALRQSSPRFGRAIAGAAHAASLSDPDILAAYVASLDPAFWLDRSARAAASGATPMGEELGLVSQRLEPMALHDRLMKVHRIFFRDFLLLRSALDDGEAVPAVSVEARESLLLLHALRLALLHRLWRLAMHIPEFSPQLGTTVEDLVQRVMRLDVTDAVGRLKEIFPLAPSDRGSGEDFGEPASYLADSQRTYEHEHAEIFDPMLRLYGLIRRIGAAVTYHMGAIG